MYYQDNLYFFSFLAVITCSFEFDLCDWQDIADDDLHKWKRKTADQIGETPGPNQDKVKVFEYWQKFTL